MHRNLFYIENFAHGRQETAISKQKSINIIYTLFLKKYK